MGDRNRPAAMASAARSGCVGIAGAAAALSNHTPASTPVGLVACVPAAPQVTVPTGTPWQYIT